MSITVGPTSTQLWQGLSTDTKPTKTDVRLKINDCFFEKDTTKYYIWDGDAAWTYVGTISIPPPML